MFCDRFDVDTMEYRAPTNNKSGGKVVQVTTLPGSFEVKDRLRFQMSEDEKTNLQHAVWGLSVPLPQQSCVCFSARMPPTPPPREVTIESPKLLEFLTKLDERNVKVAHAKSEEWFKKQLTVEQIKNMYVPLVKQPYKEDSKPLVRVKVKCAEYATNIFSVKTDATPLVYTKSNHEELTKGAKCLIMCETVGLWFMSRQFGMSLTATDIIVWPNRRPTGIQAFTLTKDAAPNEEMALDMQYEMDMST